MKHVKVMKAKSCVMKVLLHVCMCDCVRQCFKFTVPPVRSKNTRYDVIPIILKIKHKIYSID